MRALRVGLLGACMAALAACVSVPVHKGVARGHLPPAAQMAATAGQLERERRLQALPGLSFSGRVALSNGRNGGSGRIDWQQSGGRYVVTLGAPVTRQSWKLSGDADSARIEGIEGGPREDADVEHLLREATGLDIPAGAMAAWASGAAADPVRFGPASLEYGVDGRLARIEQDGWTIDYLGWQDVADGSGQALPMPNRIDARRAPAKVRLAIDAWSLAPELP